MRFIYSRAFAIFAGCLVALALAVFLQTKGWLGPLRTLLLQAPRPVVAVSHGISVPIKNFFSTIYTLNKITKENSDLSQKVFTLQNNLVNYDQAKRENEALRKELGFYESTKGQFQPCSVISQNPLGLHDTIVLNCGTGKGIAEGKAVVSQGYLVGKIIYVGPNFSTALLIDDSQFSADARLSKSGSSAVIKGSFGSGILLDQLSQNELMSKGDLVVTAGINGDIPKNILIGEVGDVISNQNDLFKRTTVLSPIELSNLQFVFVSK